MNLILGDCIEKMREMPDNSIDSIVTDPPYGLEFMGKAFDTFKGNGLDPGFCHWFAGFSDGEGCFHVHKKNVNGHATYDCQFSINLRADDGPILTRIQRELGIGTIANRPASEGKHPQTRFCVSSKGDCLILRDVFRAFPLRAKKAFDFEMWSEALEAWLNHERGEWDTMRESRDRLMASRGFKPEGVRVDPFQLWSYRWATEALRVLKPGGHMLAFGGTRTYHRLACAIEDAGFEIRDSIDWIYGSGFPKSMDVSKAIDKAAGVTRTEVTGVKPGHEEFATRTDAHSAGGRSDGWERPWRDDPDAVAKSHMTFAPATPEAEQWQGWGTALKPAHEPIVLARKPLIGTVAKNVLAHGTGALNIDGCRIEGAVPKTTQGRSNSIYGGGMGLAPDGNQMSQPHAQGRWPANIILDEEAGALLDEQTGTLSSGKGPLKRNSDKFRNTYGTFRGEDEPSGLIGDSGGASRFFYCAKASKSERNSGLEDVTAVAAKRTLSGGADTRGRPTPTNKNTHPTVKPVALMRYLVRLITPPEGICLDPFMGSGTTGIAAGVEGFDFIGIERDAEYMKIAEQRIAHACPIDGDAECAENDHLFSPRRWTVEVAA